jgi:hypothetical protein
MVKGETTWSPDVGIDSPDGPADPRSVENQNFLALEPNRAHC